MNVGYVSKNIELMVVDHRRGKRLTRDKCGEIYCKSSCAMMRGYYHQNAMTRFAINKKGLPQFRFPSRSIEIKRSGPRTRDFIV